MSEAYIGAIQEHCPNAKLVLDRFHIVKALNAAVDEVRKDQWRKAAPDERKAMKGLRWLLYRHSATRSRGDTRTLKALEKANYRIYRAWRRVRAVLGIQSALGCRTLPEMLDDVRTQKST